MISVHEAPPGQWLVMCDIGTAGAWGQVKEQSQGGPRRSKEHGRGEGRQVMILDALCWADDILEEVMGTERCSSAAPLPWVFPWGSTPSLIAVRLELRMYPQTITNLALGNPLSSLSHTNSSKVTSRWGKAFQSMNLDPGGAGGRSTGGAGRGGGGRRGRPGLQQGRPRAPRVQVSRPTLSRSYDQATAGSSHLPPHWFDFANARILVSCKTCPPIDSALAWLVTPQRRSVCVCH
jgi:hypothetical protein